MKPIRKIQSDLALTIEPDSVMAYPQCSFQKRFSFVIIFGQFFGIMPFQGVNTKNPQEVRFSCKSFRFFYAVYNVLGALVMGCFYLLHFSKFGLELDKTGFMTFYISNVFASFQFIMIAKNWSTILKEWALIENSMRSYGPVENIKNKFILLTTIVMTLALAEHLLFIANSLSMAALCGNYTLYTSDKIYFHMAFPSVFNIVEYSIWKACFVELANIISTVTWNYTDLFIILISCSLASRFAQINNRLENNKVMQENFWKEVREDYNKLSHLTHVVDQHLSALVTISFFSNAFLLCVQLYNSLKERVGYIETVYYFFSFGFLVARTIAVTLYGAWIHDESRKPLTILNSIPSEHYCVEVTRFIQQIDSSPVAITGSRFFMITRSFLLRLASTVVTVELMFLQFGPYVKGNSNLFNKECIH